MHSKGSWELHQNLQKSANTTEMAAVLAGLLGSLGLGAIGTSQGLLGCLACQACTCIGGQICSCLCGICFKGGSSREREKMAGRWARLIYLALAIVTILIAGIFRDNAPESMSGDDIISKNLKCDEGASPTCIGRAFVLRVCFATAVFHLCMGLMTMGAWDFSDPRVLLHAGWWPLKIGMWLLFHLVVFFIPSSFFLGFGWVAMVASVFFLLIQMVIFIEWIYDWNESWIKQDGADNISGPWHMAILGVSAVCYILAIAMTVIMYLWFGKNTADPNAEGGCELYTFFTTWNLLVFIFLSLVAFRATEWMPATGIMPSALVSAFMTFKVLTALYAQTQCNTLSSSADADSVYTGPPGTLTAISVIIAIVLAAYSSIMISKAWEEGDLGLEAAPAPPKDERKVPLVPMDVLGDLEAPPNSQEEGAAGKAAEPGAEPDPEPLTGPLGYNPAAFHLSFALGILYVAMQITNWNEDFKPGEVHWGPTSLWLKMADSWVLALAYFWSMMAPKLLTSRTFEF